MEPFKESMPQITSPSPYLQLGMRNSNNTAWEEAMFHWQRISVTQSFLTLILLMALLRPNSWTKSRQKSKEFSSLLFTLTSTALHRDFYFFKLMEPLIVSTVQLLHVGLRNPYRNLKSENSQDYAQKPQ